MAMTDAERKAKQRKQEAEALAKLGGGRIQFIVYGATMRKLAVPSSFRWKKLSCWSPWWPPRMPNPVRISFR